MNDEVVCRFPTKRGYVSEVEACKGALRIQANVERSGRAYNPLYPYQCDDGGHWHLSHYPQGTRYCPRCKDYAPAWFGGRNWVVAHHLDADGTRCGAVGTPLPAEEEAKP